MISWHKTRILTWLMETRIPRNPTIKETWNSMNLMSRNSFNTYMIYRSRQTFNNRIHHIFLFPPWKYFCYGLKNNPSHFHPNINTDKDNFDRSQCSALTPLTTPILCNIECSKLSHYLTVLKHITIHTTVHYWKSGSLCSM